jgi:branched-chain amino acid transport system substrate-binding protein
VSIRNKAPILIGFSGQLTGKQAELGVQERNGVQLAIEKINSSGGIAGRKINLIIRDDMGIPERAFSVDNELINEGVSAIIGHATTAQTMAGLKATNPAKVVMISPTVSTPELSGVDDYLFRVYPSFKNSSQTFAKYVYESSGIGRMAIIYDKDNYSYSNTYSSMFSDKFEALGGVITESVSFSSMIQPDFSLLLSKLRESKAEGLLIVASDIDLALIAQRARIMGWQVPLFTSEWGETKTVIRSGGHAVEGMKFQQSYNLASKSSVLIDFKTCYEARFGGEPSFSAAFGYETTLILAEALKKTYGKKDGLKEALLEIHNFQGLADTISFDSFGDIERPCYFNTIIKGKFIAVDKVNSTNFGGE